MPRTARASVGGYCYHVINRGNARSEVFHADGDYHAFMDLLSQASQRIPLRVLAYCLMPNHFHLALWQGRFKAFPIEQDDHLLTVLRAIELNPVRANLVSRADGYDRA